MGTPAPFTVEVAQATLDDLKLRLMATRWPIAPEAAPWAYGTSLPWMREVAAYWRDRYDWRRAERELNRFQHYKCRIQDVDIHYIVEQGSGPQPMPLILTHGWPGSFVEFLDLIEPLAHPERHGGDARDAFTVIVPSLPGYGFSGAPPAPISPRQIAGIWHALMSEVLGFRRYVAQGGDWGAIVSSWLALDFPDSLAALHLNMVAFNPLPLAADARPLDVAEQAYLAAMQQWSQFGSGYGRIQGTKPQTLSYALTDSPVGLAAWILEKFHSWTNPGEDRPPPFNLDTLLTNVMLYWINGINAANWLYLYGIDGSATRLPASQRVGVPTAALLFPQEIGGVAPEQWIQRGYNLVRRRTGERGGHFAALENGPVLLADLREFVRDYR